MRTLQTQAEWCARAQWVLGITLVVMVIGFYAVAYRPNKEKLDGATQSQLESAIADARKALEEGGVERLNNAFSNLQTASHKLAESLYQQGGAAGGGEQASAAGASTGAAGGGPAASGDDNVIDAEYVDVDENK